MHRSNHNHDPQTILISFMLIIGTLNSWLERNQLEAQLESGHC